MSDLATLRKRIQLKIDDYQSEIDSMIENGKEFEQEWYEYESVIYVLTKLLEPE